MTDEQHEIEKSDIFLFIRERKKKKPREIITHLTGCFFLLFRLNTTTTTTIDILIDDI
jgi:sarcosine oxidase delta subunit